jgi:hypothetical protein
MKKILSLIWKKKIAWFVLITGIITLFRGDSVVGGALVGCSIPMFDVDDDN